MNKAIFLLIIIILIFENLHSQNDTSKFCTVSFGKRISSDHFKSRGWNYKWIFNGQSFNANTNKIHLTAHYPNFDTLIFIYNHPHFGNRNDTILTRFKPKSSYKFTIGCCDSYFNIVKLDENLNECTIGKDSILYCFPTIVNGNVRFKLIKFNKKDTLIGLYTDFAGMVEGKILKNNKFTKYFKASKGYFTTNIDNIVVAEFIGSPKYLISENNMIDWNGIGSDGLLIHAEQSIVLLHNEKVTAFYNYKTDKLIIKIDE